MPISIECAVVDIIAEQALVDRSEVNMDILLVDLGVDSLALVESIFAIEEVFDIDIPFNANDPQKSGFDITSVGSIVKAVQKLVSEQSS